MVLQVPEEWVSIINQKINANDFPRDFNLRRLNQKINTSMSKKYLFFLRFFIDNRLDCKVKCTQCSLLLYIYEFKFVVSNKHSNQLNTKCNSCIHPKTALSHKQETIKGLRNRSKRKYKECPDTGERNFINAIEAQNNKCFYTGIPFEDFGKFSASPERFDRTRGYAVCGNVAAISQITNVGHQMNWDLELTKAMLNPLSHPLIISGVTEHNYEIHRMVGRMEHNSSIRNKRSGVTSHRCELTNSDVVEILKRQEYRCAISRLPLALAVGHPFNASADRLDNTRGYTKDNVRIVIARLNDRHSWTPDDYNKLLRYSSIMIREKFPEYIQSFNFLETKSGSKTPVNTKKRTRAQVNNIVFQAGVDPNMRFEEWQRYYEEQNKNKRKINF